MNGKGVVSSLVSSGKLVINSYKAIFTMGDFCLVSATQKPSLNNL